MQEIELDDGMHAPVWEIHKQIAIRMFLCSLLTAILLYSFGLMRFMGRVYIKTAPRILAFHWINETCGRGSIIHMALFTRSTDTIDSLSR